MLSFLPSPSNQIFLSTFFFLNGSFLPRSPNELLLLFGLKRPDTAAAGQSKIRVKSFALNKSNKETKQYLK